MKRHIRASHAAMLLACWTVVTTAGAQSERKPAPSAPGTPTPIAPVASSAPAAQPRIGLALSGGGARGIAHVGVLKVLDEMRMPISCVTGTSMGAIVGGDVRGGHDRRPKWRRSSSRPTGTRSSVTARRARRSRSGARSTTTRRCSRRNTASRTAGWRCPRACIAGVVDRVVIPRAGDAGLRHHGLPASCRFRSARWPPTSRPASRSCSTRGSSRRRCAPACRFPARSRRSRSTAGCWSTAASPTICRSTRRASSARTSIIAVNISTPPLKRKRDHLGGIVGDAAPQFSRQADGRRPAQEPGTDRDVLIAPDLGDISAGNVRPLEGRDQDRRGGDARARRQAQALQPAARPVRGAARTQIAERKALGTVDEIRIEGLERRIRRSLRALIESKPGEPLSEEKIGADLRRIYGARRLTRASTIGSSAAETGPRAMVIEPTREVVGAGLPALRPRPRQRLPGRQRIQRAGPVPQDLAQPPGRRVD